MSLSQPFGLPDFDPKVILQLFLAQQYGAIADEFLRILGYIEQQTYTKYPLALKTDIDQFLNQFFYIFSQPTFELPKTHAQRFIHHNKLIANLTAISSYQTTDIYLKMLLPHWDQISKILTLYSPRNHLQLDYNKIFNSDPDLACYWYSLIFSHYHSGLVNKNVAEKLRFHCTYDHPHLTQFFNHPDLYFGSSFIDPDLDRILKYQINQSLQKKNLHQKIKHKTPDISLETRLEPKPKIHFPHRTKKIGIVSDFWYPEHSIYRTLYYHIASLRKDYELTLIYFQKHEKTPDSHLFNEVVHLDMTAGKLDEDVIDFFRKKEFACLYFTEVGMGTESIYLANLRLAPIQCSGVGYGVSSFGAKIDYFLSGKQVERPKQAEDFYSERLVLLPGTGITHQPIQYQPTGIDYQNQRCLIINCPWSAPKVNLSLVQGLKKMTEKAHQPLLFRFFCGSSLRDNSYLTFVEDVSQILPREYFEVVPAIAYQDYMGLLEMGAIALDSFHFGGCSSVVDNLYLGKPMVVYEGDRWYNRIGAHILRQAGLVELVATTEKDYFKLALKLILDKNYRQQVSDHLQQLDFQSTLFNPETAQYFQQAIAYLLANHRTLQQQNRKEPIVIE